jgi:5-methylcytosine-specific restriction endonuclease McrA
MEQALLLNATYEPLKVVNWQKAITLWCQGKVEVIAHHEREIRSVSVSFKLPSVIRLLRFVKIRRRFDYVPFLPAEYLRRDHHTCQYCRKAFATPEPHFRPRGAGGARRAKGLGEHRHVLRELQPQEGRAHAG